MTFREFLETPDKIREALKKVKRDGQKDSLHVWWHPDKKKAFISVGDWCDDDAWHKAVGSIVGKNNITGESESSPHGEGWIQVRDTRRIYDSLKGMGAERKKMTGD